MTILKNLGFTLIELAVSLMIIGLLIGGIFTGQSLIHSAELREVIGEKDRYVKALKEFEDKYQAKPGDMNNAETIWGSDTACPTTLTNTTPKTVTCNGDGNGRIGASSTAGVLSNSYEWFRAWQQLANAGLIEGKFTGVRGPIHSQQAVVGVNVPQSKLKEKAGWTLLYYLSKNPSSSLFGDDYGHILVFGSQYTNLITQGKALSPSDALSIDQKIDDGLPGRGSIRTYRTGGTPPQPNCTTNDVTQDAATYNTAYTSGVACSLIFILGF